MQSRNYPPSAALAPLIRRFYVFEAELPSDFVMEDFLLAETAFVRVLLKGEWAAEMEPGQWAQAGQVVFFGANTRPLKVRVKGGFNVVGFAIRPSAWRSLFPDSHRGYADTMMPLEALWGTLADEMLVAIKAAKNDEEVIAAMERTITRRQAQIAHPRIDDAMAEFELIASTDSTMRVEDAADHFGLSVRQLERRCIDAFGMPPKAVLRRSRFLDMAAAMRGFSNATDSELAALRYFDQSHLTREFKRFAGMTPGVFAKANTPLQTAGLKLREEGKKLYKRG